MAQQTVVQSTFTNHSFLEEDAREVVQRTQAQYDQLEHLTLTTIVALDTLRANVDAFVDKPGRDPHRQKTLQDNTAHYMALHQKAVAVLHQRGSDTICANKPPQEVVKRILVPEPRRPFMQRLLGR